MTGYSVAGTRLWSRLMDLAEIGATANGGAHRLPLSAWQAASPERDAALWEQSVHDHEGGLDARGAQAGTAVAGSRPVLAPDGQPCNRAFLWQNGRVTAEPHEKAALPDEELYWERRWYGAGKQQTVPLDWNGLRIGCAICTEMWDWTPACRLSQAGAGLLLVPRATPDLGSASAARAAKTAYPRYAIDKMKERKGAQ